MSVFYLELDQVVEKGSEDSSSLKSLQHGNYILLLNSLFVLSFVFSSTKFFDDFLKQKLTMSMKLWKMMRGELNVIKFPSFLSRTVFIKLSPFVLRRQISELEVQMTQNSKKLKKLKAETENLENHVAALHM